MRTHLDARRAAMVGTDGLQSSHIDAVRQVGAVLGDVRSHVNQTLRGHEEMQARSRHARAAVDQPPQAGMAWHA